MPYDFVTLKCSVKMSPSKETVTLMRKMPRSIPFYCNLLQTKGRIERLWDTSQDRLKSELRIAGVKPQSPKLVVLINLPQIIHGGDLSRCILTGVTKS
jgi:hypothetical protein